MIEQKKIIQNNITKIQNLILENREKLTATGVVDVLSFDDQIVLVETDSFGLLTVKGENLKINKLNLDNSELIIEGDIQSLIYSDKDIDKKNGNGFLGKIFK